MCTEVISYFTSLKHTVLTSVLLTVYLERRNPALYYRIAKAYILTVAIIWGASMWLENTEQISFT